MVKEYAHLEFRCDLLKFGRVMTNEVRENVTELKLQLLDSTPFGKLFRAYYEQRVIESACRKSDIDIVALLKCFDKGQNAFRFGEINGTVSAGDIAEIFGLNVDGREIPLNQKKRKGGSEFIKRRFADDNRMSKSNLEKKIKDVAKLRGLEDERDFVRLVCLYFCVTLFFCNSGNDLSWFIVPYIEDLESMSLYAWAPAVKNYLDNSLIGMNGRPESACGCLIALLFWFCKRTRCIEPIQWRKEMKPTFLKWNLQELYAKMKVVDLHQLKEFEEKQSTSVLKTPINESYGLATTGSEEVGSKQKCVDEFDTSNMFELFPTQFYQDDNESGPSSREGIDLGKRVDELADLLKKEQARNESLRMENERLESEIKMLRACKKVGASENQTSRNLRSRSRCKKPSFLIDYVTDNGQKGKEKVEITNNDDDDFVRSSPKKKKVPSVAQNIGVRRQRVGKCMALPYAQKLEGFLSKGQTVSPRWRGVKTGVPFKDVLAIFNEEAVSVQAMDLYLEILSQQQPQEGEPMCLFLPTFKRDDVNGGDISRGIVEAHCETFFDDVCKKDLVFLPIMHKKHQQFTLLVLNKGHECWEHYSMQSPRRSTLVDQFFEDASKLHATISNHLAFLKKNGKSIMKKKMIWKHVNRGGNMSLCTYNVSDKERDLLTWLGNNAVESFPIVSAKGCLKQDPSSVDNGIAVMYIIKQLSEDVRLETTFAKGAMTQQRAHVLERFLSHIISV